ncbi:ABC transporter permease subunit [Gordonia metallireducens]|uniref:ABC transporter permease subunit n=1 Tax=Gordonia metallireducens TaxID=2897779 RepID=UPI0027E16F10|nr:hypothetical protein [Gordonia metallireducens]
MLGRRAFAVGGSPTAAKLSGIPVISTYVMTYAVAAIAYGLAGIALLGYSSGADLSIGNSWLLPSITAVVVGGSSIRGGAGAFIGTVGGAILITLLGTDISAAGLAEGWKQVLYGHRSHRGARAPPPARGRDRHRPEPASRRRTSRPPRS